MYCQRNENVERGLLYFSGSNYIEWKSMFNFFFSMVSHWKKKQLTNEKHYSDEIILKRWKYFIYLFEVYTQHPRFHRRGLKL